MHFRGFNQRVPRIASVRASRWLAFHPFLRGGLNYALQLQHLSVDYSIESNFRQSIRVSADKFKALSAAN